jgi:hypothetical protein
MSDNREEYWAQLEKTEVCSELRKKIEDWYSHISTTGIFRRMRKCYLAYYGFSSAGQGHTSSEVTYGGAQGELSLIKVNQLRNIVQHMLVMTTSTRPSMDARATNTDYKSLSQTVLANSILDYYMRERKLERYLRDSVETSLIFGEAFIRLSWDTSLGDEYMVDNEGKTVFTGDIKFSVHNPMDVIRDVFQPDANEHDWMIVRSFKNRYELMSKYPELKDELMTISTKDRLDFEYMFINFNYTTSSDLIPVYEWYHRRTESMPNGRYITFIDNDVVFYDGDLPYRDIPLYRITPSNQIQTPFGYTAAFDLLALQDITDALHSTIVTNQSTFGVQNIAAPQGHNLTVSQLGGGLNFIEYDPAAGKPEPLNLTFTPPEIFNYLGTIEKTMETISGVNSVARGNPEANLRSGNSLALVQSMAIQFNNGLQQSYAQLIEDVGTAIIKTLKDFASVERTAILTGKNNKSNLKSFKGDDLKDIDRVIVDLGNPLSKCLKKGTKVLMYDGSLKKVEDIKIGEQVMGPDSKLRTVSNVNIGQEEMFDIYHKKTNPKLLYGCNKSHILSLKYCSKDGRYGLKQYDIVDVSVGEFLTWPAGKQQKFMGFRTGVEFQDKDTPVPPYQLGLWLGDGHKNTPAITTMDEEIKQEWYEYAKAVGHDIRVQDQPNNQSKVYFITSSKQNGSNDRNCALNAFKSIGVINNKHIPDLYKINSTNKRLELLAGILDTDGTLISGKTFVITQKNNELAKDIIYLARSLGFKVTSRKRISFSQNKTRGIYNSITISGDTWRIPTRLPRKKANKSKHKYNHLNYGISIKSTGPGTYYGFTLKEEPHFVLGDFTVTHNTTAGKLEMANNLMQMGLIKSPDQYMTVMKTGNLDVMLEGPLRELTYIKQENEWLADGKEAPVLITDNHLQHIMEHKSVLSTIEARMNPEVMRACRIHIEEHVNAMKNADPDVLSMLGIQPLQPGRTQMDNLDPNQAVLRREQEMQAQIAQQSMMGGMPQLPAGTGQETTSTNQQVLQQGLPGEQPGQEMPQQPGSPTNPLSGGKWNPQTGGM